MRTILEPFQSTLIRIGLLAIVALLSTTSCFAGDGATVKLPQGKRVKNGIIADLDCRWVNGMGHRPVRVRFSVRKTNRDRTITVHLFPNSWGENSTGTRVTQKVDIPQGEKQVEATIYVPQENGSWNWFRAEFYEDGKKLEDLSMENGFSWNNTHHNSGEQPCVLVVDSAGPDWREDRTDVIKKLRSEFRKSKKDQQNLPNIETISILSLNYNHNHNLADDEYDNADVYRDVDSLEVLKSSSNIELVPPTGLPDSYVGYGSIDLVVLSVSELRTLQENSPARFQAIDGFVRNGGNLIVFGESGLQQVASELFRQQHNWTPSDPHTYYRSEDRLRYYDTEDEGADRATRNQRLKAKLDGFPKFHLAPHGLGKIVVSDAEDPFLLGPLYWRFMIQNIGKDRLSWVGRHGINLDANNPDFWDFLIPGYGATPVVSFLSVIALFVICIGPINFFMLKRIKRFYLLPITVVLAAIATTSVMMIYALLSDGVERRVRLRSFTALEKTSDGKNMAATHCRHAYLAAVAPTDGLVFPERTIAYPIVAQHRYNQRRRQRVNESQSQREYHYGYIGSRSTTQFLTTDVQETENTLAVLPDADGTIRAVNKLGVAITHAWIVDKDGAIWYSESCEPDGTLNLSGMKNTEARKLFTTIKAKHRPRAPKGLDQGQNNGFFGGYAYSQGQAFSGLALLTSEIDESAKQLASKTPNTFVVITSDAPSFVTQGLSASQEAGFHVIRGRWSP